MAKVTSFVICDNIQQQAINIAGKPANSVFHLINPIPTLAPLTIPGMFSFSVSIGVGSFDTSIPHVLDVRIIDPDNLVVNEIQGISITAFPDDIQTLPKEYRAILFNADFRNIVIEKTGVYTIQVDFDQENIGTFSIPAYPSHQNK